MNTKHKFHSQKACEAVKRFSGTSKWWLWLAFLGFSLLSACKSVPTLTEKEEVEIYTAVIDRIYTQDDTFGGTFKAPDVYLLTRTDDGAGGPDIIPSASQPISKAVQTEIVLSLAHLPARIVWVDDSSAVPMQRTTGAVANNGAILTLGNIHSQGNGTHLVSASIYIASMAAGGQTYTVEKVNGVWEITGTTGSSWIS